MASSFHLAQVNIRRILAPLTDPVMAGFLARIAEISRAAESPDALKQLVYRAFHQELLPAPYPFRVPSEFTKAAVA